MRAAADAQRGSLVESAQVPPAVKAKADRKRSPEGFPMYSLFELLRAPALNHVTLAENNQHEFPLVAQPMVLQAKTFALLGANSYKIVSS